MSAVRGGVFRTLLGSAFLLLLPLSGTPQAAPAHGDGLAPPRALSAVDLQRLQSKGAKTTAEAHYLEMSPMGAVAAGVRRWQDPDVLAGTMFSAPLRRAAQGARFLAVGGTDIKVHGDNDVGLQSETSIAANADASVLVAGYNDARGFSTAPVSLSGISRSVDGGATWSEVPVGPGGAGTLPGVIGGSVFGDPDVKFDPTRNIFVYSSIYVRPFDGLQGMCIHYSNADGSVWTGPIEVTPAFIAGQAADKEFIDIDPTTGRILMTWTMFSASPSRILAAYSDDLGANWSTAKTLQTAPAGGGVQSSIPRWAGDGLTAYATWRTTAPTTGARGIGFSKSVDGGDTWTTTAAITTTYTPEDQILGIDRVNNSPGMAVDYASGNIYIVYQANNLVGEGDVGFQVSTNGGSSFSTRALINSNPGADRAQFYPWVAVDQGSGRVHVIWYDQDSEDSGDMTEFMHAWSDNSGTTWSRPVPLFDHPFHAGYGNDTSQPNVGDYNQAVAVGGVLHSVAASNAVSMRFDEGQPTSTTLFSPDTYYDQKADATNVASLRLGTVTVAEECLSLANGAIDPGETIQLDLPIENYVNNPINSPTTFTGIIGTLAATTPGVTILDGARAYPDASPLAVVANALPFRLKLDSSFTPGDYLDLQLTVNTSNGSTELPFRLATGTEDTPVVLIDENFDGAVAPALPAGWSFANAGGSATPAWVTATTIPGGGVSSNMAFHANSAATKWHRLFSPVVAVPAAVPGNRGFVMLDFDLAVSTEDELSQAVLAYDGLTLRITDQTGGSLLRSVLAEAFAEYIQSGSIKHFPKHLPRSSSSSYLEDMSVWSGFSGGFFHVSMKFPSEGMNGRSIQLRFEYTEDGAAICTTNGYPGPCGVGIDNVVLRYVPTTDGFTPTASTTSLTTDVNPAVEGDPVELTATVIPGAATGTVEFFDGATSLGTAPVAGGMASLSVNTLDAGSHQLHAVYLSDACHDTSTSDDYKQDITQVTAVEGGLPGRFAITSLAPNPTLGETRIGFALPRSGPVSLAILDVQGREVATLTNGVLAAGRYDRTWDGRIGGEAAAAGIYFVRLKAGDATQVRRLAMTR